MPQNSLTKTELINWLNQKLDTNYIKIGQLGDCIAYLQLLHIYFPDKVILSKADYIKIFYKNAKQLEKVINKIECQVKIDYQKLSHCKFSENFKFLQWLYKNVNSLKQPILNYHPFEERCKAIGIKVSDPELTEKMQNHLIPNEFIMVETRQSQKTKKQQKPQKHMSIQKILNTDINTLDFEDLKYSTVHELEQKWHMINLLQEIQQERNLLVEILVNIERITKDAKNSAIKNQIIKILKQKPKKNIKF